MKKLFALIFILNYICVLFPQEQYFMRSLTRIQKYADDYERFSNQYDLNGIYAKTSWLLDTKSVEIQCKDRSFYLSNRELQALKKLKAFDNCFKYSHGRNTLVLDEESKEISWFFNDNNEIPKQESDLYSLFRAADKYEAPKSIVQKLAFAMVPYLNRVNNEIIKETIIYALPNCPLKLLLLLKNSNRYKSEEFLYNNVGLDLSNKKLVSLIGLVDLIKYLKSQHNNYNPTILSLENNNFKTLDMQYVLEQFSIVNVTNNSSLEKVCSGMRNWPLIIDYQNCPKISFFQGNKQVLGHTNNTIAMLGLGIIFLPSL